ncbi:MAG: glycosyltransferase family 9 protein [Muribaculaceae bacterium]|nr:glycosyltransferase family 9 protein [Muribaculaceae bacterium]
MTDASPKHLLIIRLSALGDVAMTVPVIYSLAHQYPHLRITVLTRGFFARLMIARPANVEIFEADPKGRHAGPVGLARLIREVRSLAPDMVADFHDVIRSRVLRNMLRLSGARVATVDKDRSARRNLTRHSGKISDRQRSYIDRYGDTLSRLGLPVNIGFTSLYPDAVRDPDAVGIAPFARYMTKTYPAELMEQVVARLSSEGKKIYLFGSKGDEAAILNEWASKYPGTESMPGKLGIEDEIALMSRLGVMVTMDSANMHIASLAGTPVVSVWGGTTPQCGFMGYGQSDDNAVSLGLPCQPCSIAGSTRCRQSHFRCMRDIAPDTIVEKVEAILSQLPKA